MMSFTKAFLVAIVGSVVANVVIVSLLAPYATDPSMPLHALSAGPVTMLTAIGAIGATIVYAIMRAFMKNPNKAFVWLSVFLLIFSFIPDYFVIGQTSGPFAGGTLGGALVLMFMHVVAAVIIVLSLVKLWGAKPAAM